MADLAMHKRAARHAGEVGLFVDSPVFEEEWATIRPGAEVTVTATQSRSIKQMRLAWALCRKIADSGVLGDCDARDVMNYLLLKAKHVRYVTNIHRAGTEVTPIVKSIRFASMDQTAFSRLFNRMVYIVTSEVLPEVPDGELRAEIENMAGVEAPEPEQPKRRRRTMPEKVSVIPATVLDDCDARDVIDYLIKGSVTPDHDPETGEVHEIPATEPVMTASRQSTQPASPGRPGDAGSDSPIPAAQPGHADVRPKSPSTSAPPAPPSPAANRKEAEPVRALTSVKDWHDYCFTWLKAMDDDPVRNDVDVLTKWNGETKLRNSCGVTADDRQQLFAFMTAIVEKKREAQKAI